MGERKRWVEQMYGTWNDQRIGRSAVRNSWRCTVFLIVVELKDHWEIQVDCRNDIDHTQARENLPPVSRGWFHISINLWTQPLSLTTGSGRKWSRVVKSRRRRRGWFNQLLISIASTGSCTYPCTHQSSLPRSEQATLRCRYVASASVWSMSRSHVGLHNVMIDLGWAYDTWSI